MAQPLRVEDGAVEFSLPTGRTPEGVVTGGGSPPPWRWSGAPSRSTSAMHRRNGWPSSPIALPGDAPSCRRVPMGAPSGRQQACGYHGPSAPIPPLQHLHHCPTRKPECCGPRLPSQSARRALLLPT
ncbi:MAG: hypothetical protein OXF25_04045 [Cyanobacteria bacterium MAG CAR3_bin_5]|nr:hypothetical protein [Cyanobacteria bacterium MAG CAR3_bin_5]